MHIKTKERIESISYEDALAVLSEKWIMPIVDGIAGLPDEIIGRLAEKLTAINKKYIKTFAEVGEEIENSENHLIEYLGELRGNDYVMQGFRELISMLGGQNEEK